MQRVKRSGTIANGLMMVAAVGWFGLTEVAAASPLSPAQARAAGPSTAGDECLKKEDVAAAVGGTVTGPKANGPLPMGPGLTVTSCEYAGSGYLSVTLNLMKVSADQMPMHKGMCEQQKHDGLTGLGDLACWYNDKHEELHVFKGTTLISIELRGKSSPTEPIKELAKKALAQVR
jgi:hypothetical protein